MTSLTPEQFQRKLEFYHYAMSASIAIMFQSFDSVGISPSMISMKRFAQSTMYIVQFPLHLIPRETADISEAAEVFAKTIFRKEVTGHLRVKYDAVVKCIDAML